MVNSVSEDLDQAAPYFRGSPIWDKLFTYAILSNTLVYGILGHLPYMVNKVLSVLNFWTPYSIPFPA